MSRRLGGARVRSRSVPKENPTSTCIKYCYAPTYIRINFSHLRFSLQMTFNEQEQNQINFLIQQLFTSNNKLIIKKAVETLGNTGADNADVVEALIHLVSSTNDEPTRWVGIQTLGKIASENDAVLKFLIELLSNARIPTNRIIAQALLKFTFNIEYLITTLSNLAINTLNYSAHEAIAYVIGQIGEGYKEAEDTLMYLI